MLERASDDPDSNMQSYLLKNPSKLNALIDHLDADPKTGREHGKIGDLWFLDRMRKVSTSVDGLVQKITAENLGQDGLTWDSLE